MSHSYETNCISWQGITIEIRYCKQWLSKDIDGYNMAHLEIVAIEPKRAPLPMSETGYKSHFGQHEHIMEHGSAVGYVTAWLESEAKFRHWQTYLEKFNQPDLFEL